MLSDIVKFTFAIRIFLCVRKNNYVCVVPKNYLLKIELFVHIFKFFGAYFVYLSLFIKLHIDKNRRNLFHIGQSRFAF